MYKRPFPTLLLNLLHLLNNLTLALSLVFKASSRNFIQSQDLLIRILDEDVLALLTLETHINNGSDNTPTVREREVHLVGEVTGLPTDDAEDYVAIVGFGVRTGDEAGRGVS